jgi:AAA15 family ATPase/GTPase
MQIRKLSIKNFKSIKEVRVECRKINLFIGQPNSGKSNLLEAIGLASFMAHGNYGNFANFVRFENMRDLFYDHLLDQPVTVDFAFGNLMIEFRNGKFVGTYYQADPASASRREVFSTDYTHVESFFEENKLKNFKFYRFHHLRQFANQGSEFLQPPHGDNLLSIIMTNKHSKKIVKEIFEKFGYRINLRPEEGRIDVVKEFEDMLVSFPYSISSETLQRLVFYITAIQSNRDSIITFEEPEAHAFPYYTKYLAERIALSEQNNQYFIATHNPYLLTSILEKAIKDDIAIFITELEDYETKIIPLSDKKKMEILEMGSDVFLNLEKLTNRNKSISKAIHLD